MSKSSRKRVSMKMVAERAGLSISAVSMALSDSPQISDQTKQRIRQVCRELGYPLERRGSRLNSLGRVGFLAIGDGPHDESLSGLTRALTLATSSRKIRLEVSAWADAGNTAGCVAHLQSFAAPMDGLLISGPLSPPLYDALRTLRVPHVVLGHASGANPTTQAPHDVRAVWSDELAMGQQAVQHLLGRGRRHLAFVCFRLLRGLYAARWLDGVRLGLLDDELPAAQLQVETLGDDASQIAAAAKRLAAGKNPPDGLILPDLHVAPRLLAELSNHGLRFEPQDVIVGGNPDVARQYGMGDYPTITEDGATLVAVALDLLASSGQNSPFNRVNLVVPYLTLNIQPDD